jgi:3-methyl-2-oxobutanoate hydroxymethyltransferase
VNATGGYRVQGREKAAAARLEHEARLLERAGACMLVLELIPSALATTVTRALSIPTIGIGAGAGCDGQVLVLYDLLGLDEDFNPKFLRKYANLGVATRDALARFSTEVRARTYPGDGHSFE